MNSISLHLDETVREYILAASGLQLHARIDYPGRNPWGIAVEDERQMLLVQEGYVGSEVYVSERVDDTWTPFRQLARTPHDIECWTFVGPNRLALFDGHAGLGGVKLFEFA